MEYAKTYFPFLEEDCIRTFGEDTGTNIYSLACERFAAMLKTADYRNNKSIKQHIERNMFPIMAYYMVLREQGYAQEEAYTLALKETQKAAHIQKAKNAAFAKLPVGYSVFKLFCKGFVRKMYPEQGWDIEWVKYDSEEIQMDFKSCIYFELTTQYGCPELCTVFCENDVVTFSGYEPKVHFVRNGTIAEGADCCDFHFLRGKK